MVDKRRGIQKTWGEEQGGRKVEINYNLKIKETFHFENMKKAIISEQYKSQKELTSYNNNSE